MPYSAAGPVIDPVLIRRHDESGPRYESYPTADRFVEAFAEPQLRQWLERRNIGGFSQALSVTVHLPCANGRRSPKYIKYLEKELALLAPALGESRSIDALHLGGGTASFLTREDMAALMRALGSTFERHPKTQCALEIDPRRTEPGRMAFLAALGFKRVSLGVQGLDTTQRVMAEARASGFESINLDLAYGLPKQTLDGFSRTLDEVLALGPDRIALCGHAPPSAERKLEVLSLAVGRLTSAGYRYLGMDHFARPHDELAVAQRLGRLARGFQGYSTHAGDLIGVGLSAIGQVGPTYYQNQKELERYYAELDAGRLPVLRGLELTADDLVRRAVIQGLMCHFRVSIESIELSHLVDFRQYFAEELDDLRRLAEEGLVELDADWIAVTPKGRLLLRAICMVFDRYLRQARERASYSRVI